jgi:hypothetical protein
MDSINLISLFVFILCALLGAVAHWFKKLRRGEVQGNLVGYLFADSPGRTATTFIVIVGAAITAATTGALDGLDIAVAWAYLKVGNLPMPTAHVLVAAFTLGWATDSGINKGGAQ